MKVIIMLLAIVLLITACHTHDHDHDHGHDHAHDHGTTEEHDHEENIITYTISKDSIELFVEFAAFAAGTPQTMRIHGTDLKTFKPLAMNDLKTYAKDGTKATCKVVKDGIVEATIQFAKAGNYDLIIETKTSFTLPQLPVAATHEASLTLKYPNCDQAGSIAYLLDQIWKGNFSTVAAQKQPVGDIIHTSGMIQAASTDLISIVAKNDGVVSIRKKNITDGTAVRAGELLFTVLGNGILEDDLEMNFLKAQSNLDQEKTNLERKKKLVEERIIGQKELDEANNTYQLAQAEFDNIKRLFDKGEKRHLVTNPTNGFVSQLLVQEGQFVKAGQELAIVLQSSRIQIKIDVSPRHRSIMAGITDAHFVNPYNNKVYSMKELDGRVLSFGKMTSDKEGHYIPMFFEINNHPDLLPGTMIEAYLLAPPQKEALCIPLAAVLEEMGSYVVFLQKSGESFEKQIVTLGANDGKMVQVLTGIAPNEKIVLQGTLQVKLASMATAVDPHAGHNH